MGIGRRAASIAKAGKCGSQGMEIRTSAAIPTGREGLFEGQLPPSIKCQRKDQIPIHVSLKTERAGDILSGKFQPAFPLCRQLLHLTEFHP
ncbi:MAG TPA: hypothetical protein DGA22_11880 [Acidobacterium sp.]|nr:hypothetical protein [Acidobacterium sp.]